jgi:hypothetical protein
VFTSPATGAAERIGEENGDGEREEVLRDVIGGKDQEEHLGHVGMGTGEISGKPGTEGQVKGNTEEGAGGKTTISAEGAVEKVKDKVGDVKQGIKNLVISGAKGSAATEDTTTEASKVSDGSGTAGTGGAGDSTKSAEAAGSAKHSPSKNKDAGVGVGASAGATKPSGAPKTKDKDNAPSSKPTTGSSESHPGKTVTEKKAAPAAPATKAVSAVPGDTVPRPSPLATSKTTGSKASASVVASTSSAARSPKTTGTAGTTSATTTSPTSHKFPAASKSPTSTTATRFPAASKATTTSTSTSATKSAVPVATSPTTRTRLSSGASAGASSTAAKSPTSTTSSRTPARSDSKPNTAGGGKTASTITPASASGVDRSTSSARRLSAVPAATPSKPGGILSKRLTPSHTGPPRSTPRPATAENPHATPTPAPLRPHVTGTPSKPTASSLAKARTPAGAGLDSHTTPSSGPERRAMSLGRASGSAARASLGAGATHTHTPASTKKGVTGETDGSPLSHTKSASTPSRTSMVSTSRLLQGTAASRARAAANAANAGNAVNSGSPAQAHGSASKTAKAGTAGTAGTVGTTSTSHVTPTKSVAGKGTPGKRAGTGTTHSEQKHEKAKTAPTRADLGAQTIADGGADDAHATGEVIRAEPGSSPAGQAGGSSSDPPSHPKDENSNPAPAEVNEAKTGPVGLSPIGRIGLAGAREAPAPIGGPGKVESVGSVLRDKEESGAEVDHANAHESGQEDRVGGSEMVDSADPVEQDKNVAEGGDAGAPLQEEEKKKAVGDTEVAGQDGAVGTSAFGRIGLAGGRETHVGGPEKIEAVGSVLREREKQSRGSGGEVVETGDRSGGHHNQQGELGPQSGHVVSESAGHTQEDDTLGEIPDME